MSPGTQWWGWRGAWETVSVSVNEEPAIHCQGREHCCRLRWDGIMRMSCLADVFADHDADRSKAIQDWGLLHSVEGRAHHY